MRVADQIHLAGTISLDEVKMEIGRSAVGNDCIAVCAPGAMITISLFMERIVIEPQADKAGANSPGVNSDEVYDFLFQPETGPVSRLLFVSPHPLFDLEEPHKSFMGQVQVTALGTAGDDWHLPVPAERHGNELTVWVHKRGVGPGLEALEAYKGTVSTPELSFPKYLYDDDTLAALFGLRRSIFECTFSPPIAIGEKRWLRLRIRPGKLMAPAPVIDPSKEGAGLTTFCQLLDILGSDTMLESFRDTLTNLLSIDRLPVSLRGLKDDQAMMSGLRTIFREVFTNGFDRSETYTRIEDHRILLVPRRCRIALLHTDGGVALQSIAQIRAGAFSSLAYRWYAGLKDYWRLDPVCVAEHIYEYVKNYATAPEAAKSNAYITYASGVEHVLGCEIIEEFHKQGFFLARKDHAEFSYYLNGDRQLPQDEGERLHELARVVWPVASRVRLAKGHFRIIYETYWGAKNH